MMDKVYFILAMFFSLFMMLVMGGLTYYVSINEMHVHPYVACVLGIGASYVGFILSPANTDL